MLLRAGDRRVVLMHEHHDPPRVAAAIDRAERQYGPIVSARTAIRIVGSRATLIRARESGALAPLGRRGGDGEWTYATADLVRYMCGSPVDHVPPAVPPENPRPVDVDRRVSAATARLRSMRAGSR